MKQLHLSAVDEWSKTDSELVTAGIHSHGRQASIRMNMINTMVGLTAEEKESLYRLYCSKLGEKVDEISDGRCYGTMPPMMKFD